MQLDRTHVVIRPRTTSEICDLALLVLRKYFAPFCFAFAVGALPWVLIDLALLGPLVYDTEFEGIVDGSTISLRIWHVWMMGSLVFIQAQIAGIFATSYIGQAVFESRPSFRQVASSVGKITHRWIWVLGIVRGPILTVGLIVACLLDGDARTLTLTCTILISIYIVAIRATRPHTPEIVILEQPPLRSREPLVKIPLGKRSRYFHSVVTGDCVSRCFVMSTLAIVLTFSIFMFFIFLQGIFYRSWSMGLLAQLVYLPLAMWIVAGFMTIVRFLAYLDFRIRLEGWDVELGLRAERERMFGTEPAITPGVGARA